MIETIRGVLYQPGRGDPKNYVRADAEWKGKRYAGGSGDREDHGVAGDSLKEKLGEAGFRGKIILRNCGVPDYCHKEYVRWVGGVDTVVESPVDLGFNTIIPTVNITTSATDEQFKYASTGEVCLPDGSANAKLYAFEEGVDVEISSTKSRTFMRLPWGVFDRMQVHVREDL